MEYGGDWFMKYKDAEVMNALADGLQEVASKNPTSQIALCYARALTVGVVRVSLMGAAARVIVSFMSSDPVSVSASKSSSAWRAIFWGGVSAGVLDILFAIGLYASRGVSPLRILQSVAAGVLGKETYKGGWVTAVLGLSLHFVIAFGAAAVFYAANRRWTWFTRLPLFAGTLFGVAVWFFMNLVVLPLSAVTRGPFPPPLWAALVFAHIVCVGWPIAIATRRWGSVAPATS